MTGRHHEIYLGDARKVAPEKLRDPFERNRLKYLTLASIVVAVAVSCW